MPRRPAHPAHPAPASLGGILADEGAKLRADLDAVTRLEGELRGETHTDLRTDLARDIAARWRVLAENAGALSAVAGLRARRSG
jgi:hypothetical protein